jgi:hypothetical protein
MDPVTTPAPRDGALSLPAPQEQLLQWDDMARDSKKLAEWGLDHYMAQIAGGLGIGLESVCCEATEPATAYLAVDQRMPNAPDRDVALFWDAVHGWAVGTETGSGEELIVVAYLGGENLLATPEVVVTFAQDLLAGRDVGQQHPPQPTCSDLSSQLGNYYVRPTGV